MANFPEYDLSSYYKILQVCNSIKFTNRELDIITCVLNNISSQREIAAFLAIAPKTVEVNKTNINRKIRASNTSEVIEYFSKVPSAKKITSHYNLLTLEDELKKQILVLRTLLPKNFFNIEVHFWGFEKSKLLVQKVEEFGFNINTDKDLEIHKKTILVISNTYVEENLDSLINFIIKNSCNRNIYKIVFLSESKNSISEILSLENIKDKIILLDKVDNYFIFFIKLIQSLYRPYLGDISLEVEENFQKLSVSFENHIKSIFAENERINSKRTLNFQTRLNTVPKVVLSRIFLTLTIIILSIVFSTINFFTFDSKDKNCAKTQNNIRSDILIPNEYFLIKRDYILEDIRKHFKNIEDIYAVALIGTGGAGKTTLARYYAYKDNSKIIWEINAETSEGIKNSFEKLAYKLSNSEEERRLLESILSEDNYDEKVTQLIIFVRNKLLNIKDWLLIYDNVESFSDIQKFFPKDKNKWGNGKVIITTKDSNIQNNKYVNHSINIGELSADEKYTLFTNIIGTSDLRDNLKSSEIQIKTFLELIPPYPLDIVVAAFYLNGTGSSYEKYVERLNKGNEDFDIVQSTLLKEAGDYSKTRYGIITISIENLISMNEDFRNLLLLICSIDSQEVPKNLLNQYKNRSIVDNFILNLKRYSLITDERIIENNNYFSIHRSFQSIAKSFLTKKINYEVYKCLIGDISKYLNNFSNKTIEEEDVEVMKILVQHYESFFKQKDLLSIQSICSLASDLGLIFYSLGEYEKSKDILSPFLDILNNKKYKDENTIKLKVLATLAIVNSELAHIEDLDKILSICEKEVQSIKEDTLEKAKYLAYIGDALINRGDYQKALSYIEKSIEIYEKYNEISSISFARVLTFEGSINNRLGNYKKARSSLERGLNIYVTKYPESNYRIGATLVWIGDSYVGLGLYEKAKEIYERANFVYSKVRPDNHPDVGWELWHLANAYRLLGNYKMAQQVIEKSISIYSQKSIFEISETYHVLGKILLDLGDVTSAKKYLESSYNAARDYYGKNHTKPLYYLSNLAKFYILEGNINKGIEILREILNVLNEKQHKDIFVVHENLAFGLFQEYLLNKNPQKKGEALNHLHSAIEIINKHFLDENNFSPHKERIQKKIEEIQSVDSNS